MKQDSFSEPSQTNHSSKDLKIAPEERKSKERLTCAFFVNASGGKEKPIVIGKSANPRCFKGIRDRDQLPCQYYNQRKAWMESRIMEEILSKLNRRLKRETRKILLFMDNAPCHPEDLDEKYDQIKVVFLPQNTTTRLQPLDLGIIQAFKLQYYKRVLTHVVSKVDECNSASEVCKSVDVLQAIRWTAMAWDGVSETTIVKCFINDGILDSEGKANTVTSTNSDVDSFAGLENELTSVQDLAYETNNGNAVSLKQVVDGCFDAPVCQELPENWESIFFQQPGRNQEQINSAASEQNEDSNDDEVKELSVYPKLSSYRAAIFAMEDAF